MLATAAASTQRRRSGSSCWVLLTGVHCRALLLATLLNESDVAVIRFKYGDGCVIGQKARHPVGAGDESGQHIDRYKVGEDPGIVRPGQNGLQHTGAPVRHDRVMTLPQASAERNEFGPVHEQ